MELRELEYVTAIADAGSLSKAADRLYLAQSSLSQFLNRLESELGTKLFVRTSGGVRPTLSGEIYIRSARQILRQYRMMRAEVQDMERPSEGRIDFGISSFRGGISVSQGAGSVPKERSGGGSGYSRDGQYPFA